MIRFKKNGDVMFSESDNGDIVVKDSKFAEELRANGINVQEAIEKENSQKAEGAGK